jgi:hypothetical protein
MRTVMGVVVLAAAAALATAALAAAAVPAASPSAASAATATTWTVSPGGKITAAAGKTTLADTPTGAVTTCQSSHMSGALKAGTGLPGSGIGSLATSVYSLCSGGPFPATVAASGLPWRLNLTSYDRSTGVARGTISHLQIAAAISFSQCTAVIKGTGGTAPDGVTSFSYTGKTGILKILATDGHLHWYHVHKCAGIINNGDAATISASYTVSPRQVITSP